MDPERLRCKTEGCEHTILPETAARTGGYCMRCVGKQKEAERQEFIRKNRREVDRFAGMTDPVEVIRELHTWRKPDPLIIYKAAPLTLAEAYAKLSDADCRRLVGVAIDLFGDGDKDLAERIAKGLATQTDLDLAALAMAWLDAGEIWPSVLFRRASGAVRDRLVAFLDSWTGSRNESMPVNHALCALAWVGDQIVHDTFARWERQPPAWREHMYVGPGGYAHTGGWEMGPKHPRSLVYDSCVGVVPLDEGNTGDVAVAAFTADDQSCPWCGRPLVKMVTIDCSDVRFAFLGWKVPRLSILTCDACTCFSDHVFARVAVDGSASWHPANVRPKHLPEDGATWQLSPWAGKPIRLETRRPLAAVESDLGVSASSIGGHPCWVQDTAYPTCPDCGQTMGFIAQLDNGDFKYHEGTYYGFLCGKCGVTATCYQQT